MKLLIINGPNLNLLGKREQNIYGTESFEDYYAKLKTFFPRLELEYFQSNIEGEIVNKIHEYGFSTDGIIINAGAYTHTSVAIRDAIAGIALPTVEVHISNTAAREAFRHHSMISAVCVGSITGLGWRGYQLALDYLADGK